LLRFGVAFSLEPSRSYPDLSQLFRKIDKYNYYIRNHPEALLGMQMWHYQDSQKTVLESARSIDQGMARTNNFIFIGRLSKPSEIDYEEILDTFDQLLPIYLFTEGNEDLPAAPVKSESFQPGHKSKAKLTEKKGVPGVTDVALRHNELEDALYQILCSKHGETAVRTGHLLGYGGIVDVALKVGHGLTFYEIKAAPSARSAIREALGQLLEYSFWPDCLRSENLVVVSEHPVTDQILAYMQRLRSHGLGFLSYCCISLDGLKLSEPV
jgi:hypothetical protein